MKKLITLGLFLSLSCKPNPETVMKEEVYNVAFSETNEIEQIRAAMYDSISTWKREKVERFNVSPFVKMKIDTLICLNKKKDKLITCRLSSSKRFYSFDDIVFFYGVKIKQRWYFFDGGGIIIERKDKNRPLNFEQLSQRAYEEVFRAYLKRNENGNLEINDDFFADLTSGAWYGSPPYPHDKETWGRGPMPAA